MGPAVEAQLVRPGFYPAGGGQFTVRIQPARQLGRLELVERGEITARRVRALVANLPRHIAERECRCHRREDRLGRSLFCRRRSEGLARAGQRRLIELESEHLTEVFTGFGQIGVPGRRRGHAGAPRGPRLSGRRRAGRQHLADQLMLPLGIGASLGMGGGAFRTVKLTLHSTTHLEVIRAFLEVEAQVDHDGNDGYRVRFGGR